MHRAKPTNAQYRVCDFKAHEGEVTCAQVGRTGHTLATAGQDCMIHLWKLERLDNLLSFNNGNSPAQSLCFNPAETTIVAGAESGAIKVFQLAPGGRVQCKLLGHLSSCTALAYHREREVIVSGSMDTNVKLWDLRQKNCTRTFKSHTGTINSVQFSPDGKWIASGSEDGSVKLWDISAGKILSDFRSHRGPINAVRFNPNVFELASASSDRTIKFWDLDSLALISTTPLCGSSKVEAIAFALDDETGPGRMAGVSMDGLKLWEWTPVRCVEFINVSWGRVGDVYIPAFDQSNRKRSYPQQALVCSIRHDMVTIWAVPLDAEDSETASHDTPSDRRRKQQQYDHNQSDTSDSPDYYITNSRRPAGESKRQDEANISASDGSTQQQVEKKIEKRSRHRLTRKNDAGKAENDLNLRQQAMTATPTTIGSRDSAASTYADSCDGYSDDDEFVQGAHETPTTVVATRTGQGYVNISAYVEQDNDADEVETIPEEIQSDAEDYVSGNQLHELGFVNVCKNESKMCMVDVQDNDDDDDDAGENMSVAKRTHMAIKTTATNNRSGFVENPSERQLDSFQRGEACAKRDAHGGNVTHNDDDNDDDEGEEGRECRKKDRLNFDSKQLSLRSTPIKLGIRAAMKQQRQQRRLEAKVAESDYIPPSTSSSSSSSSSPSSSVPLSPSKLNDHHQQKKQEKQFKKKNKKQRWRISTPDFQMQGMSLNDNKEKEKAKEVEEQRSLLLPSASQALLVPSRHDSPLGLSFTQFMPKQRPKSQDPSSSNDDAEPSTPSVTRIEIANQLVNDRHGRFQAVMKSRAAELRQLSLLWQQGNVSGVIRRLKDVGEPGIVADVLRSANFALAGLDLELCAQLLPLIAQVLTATFETHVQAGLDVAGFLFASFEEVLKSVPGSSTLSSCARDPHSGIGVDMAREERLKKCDRVRKGFAEVLHSLEGVIAKVEQQRELGATHSVLIRQGTILRDALTEVVEM